MLGRIKLEVVHIHNRWNLKCEVRRRCHQWWFNHDDQLICWVKDWLFTQTHRLSRQLKRLLRCVGISTNNELMSSAYTLSWGNVKPRFAFEKQKLSKFPEKKHATSLQKQTICFAVMFSRSEFVYFRASILRNIAYAYFTLLCSFITVFTTCLIMHCLYRRSLRWVFVGNVHQFFRNFS